VRHRLLLVPLLIALAVLVASAAAIPGGAAVKRKAKPKPALTVRVLTVSQRSLLSHRRLRVRLTARRAMRLRLYATARRAGRGRPTVVVSAVRQLRVRRSRRARVVTLAIGAAGRRELSLCARRGLTVHAIRLSRRGTPLRPRYGARRLLRRDTTKCVRILRAGGEQAAAKSEDSQRKVAFDTDDSGAGGRCDFIDPAVCLFPWPNDYFTIPDKTTDTGRRLNLDVLSMPRNRANKPIEPSDYNRSDGFSPGQLIVTKVPGLDNQKAFDRTGAVPITDMARAFDSNQPVVVINARTGRRQLVWSEIDSNPQNRDDVTLLIRPGINFDEGGRYIVALRDLKDENGKTLAAPEAFRLYRDRITSTNPEVEARRNHFEALFRTLADAGIDRGSLYRAWDFTVASENGLTERMRFIRDDAFAQLGDRNLADLTVQGNSPAFSITKTENFTAQDNRNIARRVEGKITVPCYLNAPGCPSGSRFLFPPGSTHGPPMPIPGNTTEAKFTCNISRAASPATPARPSLYGHGLFGTRSEVSSGNVQDMAGEHNFMFCATEWIGMACSDVPDPPDSQEKLQRIFDEALAGRPPQIPECDVPYVATVLTDLSGFPGLADRVQQGMLNFLFLGRAMIHPNGFASNSAFQEGGRSLIDTRRLFYDGNSQGGIIGGSLAAVAPDYDRAVLGVPGMNYSTLLQRSTDFGTGQPPSPDPTDPESFLPEYAYPLYQSYPNELERQLILSLIQIQWDRSEADGYAHHMTTDPLPNTPAHTILMHGALGDHQVAQITAEVEARTIGARVRRPFADAGRDRDKTPAYGLDPFTSPFSGSAYVLWDSGPIRTGSDGKVKGTDPPPATNTPPMTGADPHGEPRSTPAARAQKSQFLALGGSVFEVCGARPCYSRDWAGP
jgi:hypothetical protein